MSSLSLSMRNAKYPRLRVAVMIPSVARPVVMGGLSYQPNAQWKVGVGAFVDEQENPGGRRLAVYGIADYFLSKRTDIYIAIDHNRITGRYTLIRSQGTYGNQLGVSLGLRHYF